MAGEEHLPAESALIRPQTEVRLFRSRPFASGNAAIFFLWGSALGAVFFLAQFLQIALRYRQAPLRELTAGGS